jgi:hypothetical protein
MFCVIAADWTRLAASGLRLPASFQSTPSWLSTQSKSVSWSSSSVRAAASVAGRGSGRRRRCRRA